MYKTALILAAGDGKRMKSELPKVLHKVCGKELIAHVLKAVRSALPSTPPTAPSIDFFGESFGAILCFPISTPTQ